MHTNVITALDFDGVLCDSAVETSITGWKAACHLWDDMPAAPNQSMIDRFRQVRPIIETGYESILAMRLLHEGDGVESILQRWSLLRRAMLERPGI